MQKDLERQHPSVPARGALEEALNSITRTLEQELFAEKLSSARGLMQSLDARVKLLATLGFLLSVGLARNLPVILAIYLLALTLGILSAVPLNSLIKRVWLALPFFTGLIALPALFLTPGPPLLRVLPWLVITQNGATAALFLLARVGTSLSLTLLLILTTPWNTLLSGLSALHLPDVLVLVLGMTYRYIYVLLHAANDMFLSRKSRAVGRIGTADSQRMLAAVGGALFGKSVSLSNEVYLAMESRGFRGSPVTLKPFKMRSRDWTWSLIFAALIGCTIALGA